MRAALTDVIPATGYHGWMSRVVYLVGNLVKDAVLESIGQRGWTGCIREGGRQAVEPDTSILVAICTKYGIQLHVR